MGGGRSTQSSQISCTEGHEFGYWTGKTGDLQNEYLSLPNMMLSITRIRRGMVRSV